MVASVAALAILIGLSAASFLTTTRLAAAVGAGAAYVPATAPFYVEVGLEPSEEQDAALRDLLGRFPPIDGVDLDRPLGDQLAELLDRTLADGDVDLSWSEDVAPWTDGRLAIAVLDIPDEVFAPTIDPFVEPAMPAAPGFVVLLGVTDADAARDAVGRILVEAGGPQTTTTEHRGVTIHAQPERDQGAYAIVDDQLIVAASVDDIVAALDAGASGETIAERDDITSLVAALPSDWLAFGIVDFTDVMQASIDAGAAESPAIADAMTRLFEHQSLRAAFTVGATGEGLAFDSAGDPPTGPFAVENAERDLAASVPNDALLYVEGGNVGAALVEYVAAFKEAAATEPEAAEGIATAEAALGAELEDLLAWIDDGAIAAGWDGTEPYAGIVIGPTDRTAAQRRLDQLATFARLAGTDGASGITVSDETVGDVIVTTIRWEDPAMTGMMMGAPSSLSVQYAIDDARVLVGIGERFVPRALELDAAESLAAEPRYVDAVAGLGGPSVAGVSWLDVAGVVDAVEPLAGQMLGEDGAAGILDWFRPLDRLVGVAVLDGEVLVQRSVLLVR